MTHSEFVRKYGLQDNDGARNDLALMLADRRQSGYNEALDAASQTVYDYRFYVNWSAVACDEVTSKILMLKR